MHVRKLSIKLTNSYIKKYISSDSKTLVKVTHATGLVVSKPLSNRDNPKNIIYCSFINLKVFISEKLLSNHYKVSSKKSLISVSFLSTY